MPIQNTMRFNQTAGSAEAGGSAEPPHTFEAFRARKMEEERLRRLHATEAARLAVPPGTATTAHATPCDPVATSARE
jgi:hypothetical protein